MSDQIRKRQGEVRGQCLLSCSLGDNLWLGSGCSNKMLDWMASLISWSCALALALRCTFGLKLVGLSGGIGSGKSTAARVLQTQPRVHVVDLDQVSRDIIRPGSLLLQKLRKEFGETIIAADGSLDRAKLAALTFGDRSQVRKLNRVMAPHIALNMAAQTLSAFVLQGARTVVLDAPLLFESGLHHLCDTTVVVAMPADVQLRRVLARNPEMTQDQVEARIKSQMCLEDRLRLANEVLENAADGEVALHNFQQRVLLWWQRQHMLSESQGNGIKDNRRESLAESKQVRMQRKWLRAARWFRMIWPTRLAWALAVLLSAVLHLLHFLIRFCNLVRDAGAAGSGAVLPDLASAAVGLAATARMIVCLTFSISKVRAAAVPTDVVHDPSLFPVNPFFPSPRSPRWHLDGVNKLKYPVMHSPTGKQYASLFCATQGVALPIPRLPFWPEGSWIQLTSFCDLRFRVFNAQVSYPLRSLDRL
eukprot:g15970.t1